ncbi:MAG: IS110 family transposase [Flavobacteriales bacterium]
MKTIKRQSIGIDAGKDDFYVNFAVCDEMQEVKHLASKKFLNTPAGFEAFNHWIIKWMKSDIPLILVVEATGVYHERLACFIVDNGYQLSVVLPKRAKDFSRTLKVKATTDKISAQYLAVMGLEKKLDLWSKREPVFIILRRLTREREQLMAKKTEVKNHIHAENAGAWPNAKTIKRFEEQLELVKKQEKEITRDINAILKENPELKARINKLCTIPGIGTLTAVTIVAETNGFDLIRNKRQLVSYAGYDVLQHVSGSSVKTKARISKRGNRHIRRAMQMPALTGIRHNETDKNTFIRIVSKTGIKMKGIVAIQRKLLVLMYTLWKNDQTYDPKYEENRKGQSVTTPLELDLVRS